VPRAAPKQRGRRAGPGPGQLAERAGGITDGRQAMLRPAGRATWPLKTCPAPAETDGRTDRAVACGGWGTLTTVSGVWGHRGHVGVVRVLVPDGDLTQRVVCVVGHWGTVCS
jgi:hypothetical protein